MILEFEIEAITHVRGWPVIFCKMLTVDTDFVLTKNARLGDIDIQQWLDIPRALDEDGKQRFDLCAFRLSKVEDETKLQVGKIVRLHP